MTTPRPRTRRTNDRAPDRAPGDAGRGPSRGLSAIPSTLWILEPGQLARDAVIRHLQRWSTAPDSAPGRSPGGTTTPPVLALTVTPTLASSPAASPIGPADTERTDQAHRPTAVPGSGSGSGGDSRPGPARPFWADMVAAATTTVTAGPGHHSSLIPSPCSDSGVGEGSGGVSLLVVEHGSMEAGDDLGRRAAQLLAPGGLLAVLSQHGRTPDRDPGKAGASGGTGAPSGLGALLDPTGSIVASAQNADLLYLQHIVLIARPPSALQAATGASGSSRPARVPESLDATNEHIDLCLFLRPQTAIPVSGAAVSDVTPRAA